MLLKSVQLQLPGQLFSRPHSCGSERSNDFRTSRVEPSTPLPIKCDRFSAAASLDDFSTILAVSLLVRCAVPLPWDHSGNKHMLVSSLSSNYVRSRHVVGEVDGLQRYLDTRAQYTAAHSPGINSIHSTGTFSLFHGCRIWRRFGKGVSVTSGTRGAPTRRAARWELAVKSRPSSPGLGMECSDPPLGRGREVEFPFAAMVSFIMGPDAPSSAAWRERGICDG